jgi:hypothetical protein
MTETNRFTCQACIGTGCDYTPTGQPEARRCGLCLGKGYIDVPPGGVVVQQGGDILAPTRNFVAPPIYRKGTR